MRRLLALAAVPFLLNGCLPALIAGGTEVGITASENRSAGRKVDDNLLYTNITDQFVKADQSELLSDVTFNIRYARVMLTGTVKTEDAAQRAVALTWKAKGVQEVINELIVDPDAGFFSTANDALIKRNLEARLLITKGVWVINYSIDVQNSNAFLIGRVADQAEMNRVMNIARTTKGVKKVVSHLQINSNVDHSVSNADIQNGTVSPDATAVTPVEQTPIPPVHSGPVDQSSTRSGYTPAPSTITGNSTVAAPDSISGTPLSAPR